MYRYNDYNRKMFNIICNNTCDGIIIIDNKNLVCFVNKYIEKVLGVFSGFSVNKYMITKRIENLEGDNEYLINKRWYYLKIYKYDKYKMILLTDISWKKKLTREIDILKKESEDFNSLIVQFGDSSLYITDDKGITTWVGSGVAEECGTTKEALISKSVYELESEKVFYPSVVAISIRSLQREIIIQTTATGKKVIAMAFPLFDKNNKLVKVISFSKRYKMDNIKTLEDVINNSNYNKDKYYPYIISKATSMIEVKNLIDLCSKVDSPVIIYGEKGSGKKNVAKLIHNMSNRFGNNFIYLDFKNKPNYGHKEVWGKGGIMERATGGTIYITNILDADEVWLDHIFQLVKERGLQQDIRVIIGCEKNSKVISNEKLKQILYYFQFLKINCPPLRTRKEDIFMLAKYFINEANKKFNMDNRISALALKNLYDYTWPGNVEELKRVINVLCEKANNNIINQNDLPENIRECYSEDFILKRNIKIQPLKDTVEQLEKYIIKNALKRNDFNASLAAKELGMTQSTISRKMQKYNIINEMEK